LCRAGAEPADAFGGASLHLEDMRERVMRAAVERLRFDRLQRRSLRS